MTARRAPRSPSLRRRAPRHERALWLGALSALVVATLGWRTAVPATAAGVTVPDASITMPRPVVPESLDAAARRIAERNPFRLSRQPSTVAFQAVMPEGMAYVLPAPRQPRPALLLTGIVGGPPWEAVLEGVPGREGGVLVHRGDTLGGLTIRAIGRDTVVVRGADTTWRLTVRRAW